MRVQNITPQLSESLALNVSKGAIVSNVIQDSPAHTNGIRLGDVITGIDDQPIIHERQVLNAVISYRPAEQVILHGLRQGKKISWKIEVGQRPIYGSSY